MTTKAGSSYYIMPVALFNEYPHFNWVEIMFVPGALNSHGLMAGKITSHTC